jgi:hypothetical protein
MAGPTLSAPGDRLHRLLGQWLDERTVRDIVEPSLADLQHELQEADGGRQWIVRWQGYSALCRALVVQGFETSAPVGSVLTLLVAGIGGGWLYAWARGHVQDPRVFNSAFLLPTAAASVTLRLIGGARSYRRVFAGLLGVGLLMWISSGGFVRVAPLASRLSHVIASAVNLGLIGTLSALGAAAVWTPIQGRVPFVRRVVLGVLSSAVTTTAVYFLGVWLTGAPEQKWAITSPFYVAMFAMPITATSLPVLFVGNRWLRTPVALAVLGALASPLAMLLILGVEVGGAREVMKCIRDAPGMCALLTLPFTVGNGVLAFRLTPPRTFGW